MLEIILHSEVMKKAISLKKSSSLVTQICFVYNINHIPFTRDSYFGHSGSIDPYSSRVDKPVHRIFFFSQCIHIFRNHRFR